MSVSEVRTLYVVPNLAGEIDLPPWPPAQPSDDLDYSLDVTSMLADVDDSIAQVTLAISPSGEGELEALDLTVQGPIVTAELSGGVAGRDYAIDVLIEFVSSRKLELIPQLHVNRFLAPYPIPEPPDTGYGTPLVWTSGATVLGPALLNFQDGLVATGTDQSTALLLPAQTNVFSSVPTGTGAILSPIISGRISVINTTDNDLLVYPPSGARIDSGDVDEAVFVSPHSSATFGTNSSSTQWYHQ